MSSRRNLLGRGLASILKNPKTDKYLQFKKFILSKEFAWRYNISTNMDFYSHVFLQRPELNGYSESHSKWTNQNLIVMSELMDYNGLYKDLPYFFLRSNANATHPDAGHQYSDPHIDHPNKNPLPSAFLILNKKICIELIRNPNQTFLQTTDSDSNMNLSVSFCLGQLELQ